MASTATFLMLIKDKTLYQKWSRWQLHEYHINIQSSGRQ